MIVQNNADEPYPNPMLLAINEISGHFVKALYDKYLTNSRVDSVVKIIREIN
jgi:hypothetical protein